MLRVKLSVVCAPVLVIGAFVLGGCSSGPSDKMATMSPEALYKEAQEEMAAGQWDKTIPFLERLESRAAGTPLAQQAQLDKAYAQYKTSEPAQALATLERFMKLHPASPAMDYALYLKGLVNFNDDLGLFSGVTRQDLAERDQKASKESFESFKELVSRFRLNEEVVAKPVRKTAVQKTATQASVRKTNTQLASAAPAKRKTAVVKGDDGNGAGKALYHE